MSLQGTLIIFLSMFGEMVKQGYLLPSFLLPPSLSSFPSCLLSRTYNYERFKEESLITLVWNHEKRHQEWVIWVFGQMGWEILNQNMWTNAMLFIESPSVTQSWLFRPLFHKVNMQPTGSHQCWHFLMLYFGEAKHLGAHWWILSYFQQVSPRGRWPSQVTGCQGVTLGFVPLWASDL